MFRLWNPDLNLHLLRLHPGYLLFEIQGGYPLLTLVYESLLSLEPIGNLMQNFRTEVTYYTYSTML